MCFFTHSFPTSEWTVNAYLRESVTRSEEVVSLLKKRSDLVLSCLCKCIDRFFLTLFYDFSSQSRYADVKEQVYVKSRRPRGGEYIKIDQICQLNDIK